MGKDGIIPRHDRCSSHKDARVSWQQFQKNKECNASVSDRLLAGRTQLVAKNRHYLKTIAEIILLLAQKELALRGHD